MYVTYIRYLYLYFWLRQSLSVAPKPFSCAKAFRLRRSLSLAPVFRLRRSLSLAPKPFAFRLRQSRAHMSGAIQFPELFRCLRLWRNRKALTPPKGFGATERLWRNHIIGGQGIRSLISNRNNLNEEKYRYK